MYGTPAREPAAVAADRSNPSDLSQALHQLGYSEFRPGQAEAVETLLRAKRLLLVAPTGGGKSLIYQLPALLLPGTSVVVSPLIALMQDQVSALEKRKVPSTFLAATLSAEERERRTQGILQGKYKLVYIAPERLVFGGFQSVLSRISCPLLAIDEAHCISEWGHDFRPEYLRIGELVKRFSSARVLACTATATPIVRDEILARLGLPPGTPQLVRGFARPNLTLKAYETSGKKERNLHVDQQLGEALGAPGRGQGSAIVYCPTRRATEEEATRLKQNGWQAAAYHAGLSPDERDSAQSRFTSRRVEIVTATNAFGMGIDRADVRAVVHLAPPGSLEAYYQEVGRAGRDQEPAFGLMLFSAQDFPMRRRLLEQPIDEREPDPKVVEHKWGLFLELMRWAEGGSCRHDAILRYFGTEDTLLEGCGRCDVCASFEEPSPFEEQQIALIIRKALSGVARVHDKFGLGAAVKLLQGKTDKRLESAGLDQVSTYGVLSEFSERWLTRLIQRCVTKGWASFSGADRPLLLLTREGHRVMVGKQEPRLLLPPLEGPRGGALDRSAGAQGRVISGGAAKGRAPELDDPNLAVLFEALRKVRLELATEAGVPPYIVASDRSLREMAYIKPKNPAELEEVHGFGPRKVELYASHFLKVIAESAEEH